MLALRSKIFLHASLSNNQDSYIESRLKDSSSVSIKVSQSTVVYTHMDKV